MTNYQIIKVLLEEMEGQMSHMRVSKGYVAGHPHWEERSGKEMLGDRPYAEVEEEDAQEEFKKVKISRAFKK